MAKEIVGEFEELWNSPNTLSFDEFYENYKERYKIIKHQRDIAKQDEITSIENTDCSRILCRLDLSQICER